MPIQTVMTAQLMCSMGMAPSQLMVLPVRKTISGSMLAANIMDYVPMANIMPFGMCITPSNPMVAAATATALGVLTPMPCIPMTMAPWIVGSPTVVLEGFPALNNSSICICNWGGVISIVNPGQVTEMIP